MGVENAIDADLLGRVHLLAEILGLDHVGSEEEIQGMIETRNVAEGIRFRIVWALGVHNIGRGRRKCGRCGIRDRGGKLLHCGRPS